MEYDVNRWGLGEMIKITKDKIINIKNSYSAKRISSFEN